MTSPLFKPSDDVLRLADAIEKILKSRSERDQRLAELAERAESTGDYHRYDEVAADLRDDAMTDLDQLIDVSRAHLAALDVYIAVGARSHGPGSSAAYPLWPVEWREAGFADSTVAPWREAGFGPRDAAAWREALVGVPHAWLRRQSGMTADAEAAAIAACLSRGGVHPAQASAWIDDAAHTGQMLREWTEAGFSAAEAFEWQQAGYTPRTAAAWDEAGIGSPSLAAGWQAQGFTAENAAVWASVEGMTPSEAMAAVNAGRAPIDVERIRRADPDWTRPVDPEVAAPDMGPWL